MKKKVFYCGSSCAVRARLTKYIESGVTKEKRGCLVISFPSWFYYITHHSPLLASPGQVGGLSASGSGLTVNSDGQHRRLTVQRVAAWRAPAPPSPRPTWLQNLPAWNCLTLSLVSPGSWPAANRTGRIGAAPVVELYRETVQRQLSKKVVALQGQTCQQWVSLASESLFPAQGIQGP